MGEEGRRTRESEGWGGKQQRTHTSLFIESATRSEAREYWRGFEASEESG